MQLTALSKLTLPLKTMNSPLNTKTSLLLTLTFGASFLGAQTIYNDPETTIDETVSVAGYRIADTVDDPVTAEVNIGTGVTFSSTTSGFMAAGNAGNSATLNIADGAIYNSTTSAVDFFGESGTAVVNVAAGGTMSTRQAVVGRFDGASGTVNIDGAGAEWRMFTWFVDVGREGQGAVNLTNGGSIIGAQRLVIGGSYLDSFASTGSGSLLVSGVGSSVGFGTSSLAFLGVGRGSVGEATVTNGGHIEATNATNAINLWVGNRAGGQGTFTISDGGTMVSNGILRITSNSAEASSMTVTGAGSSYIGALESYIGNTGNGNLGTLNVQDGGTVELQSFVHIGNLAGANGRVNVAGADSTLTTGDYIRIGSSGTGELNITNGGTVTVQTAANITTLGRFSGSSGTVLVSGADSSFVLNNSLNLAALLDLSASGGSALLTVENGGLVSAANFITAAHGAQIVLDGGSLTAGNALRLFGDGSESTVTLSGNGTVNGDVVLSGAASLLGDVTGLMVTGVVSGSGLVSNAQVGGLAVAATTGAMTLNNVSFNSPMTLTIDDLSASGLVVFDQATDFARVVLSIEFSNVTPVGDEVFNLFTYTGDGEATYNFASVNAPTGWLFDNGVLSAIPEPSAYAALVGLLALGLATTRRRSRE